MPVTFHARVLVGNGTSSDGLEPAQTTEHGGRTYVVASPGQQFKVRAEVKGLRHGEIFQTWLDVDGKSTGFSLDLTSHYPTAVFDGWYAGNGQHTEFLFASAQSQASLNAQSSGGEGPEAPQSLGSVKVTFARQKEVPCTRGDPSSIGKCEMCEFEERWFYGGGVPQARAGEGPRKSRSSDDKKFFLKPSLRAASSGKVCSSFAWTKAAHYERDLDFELVKLVFQCESRQTLALRKILPPLPLLPRSALGRERHRQAPVKREVKEEANAVGQSTGQGTTGRRGDSSNAEPLRSGGEGETAANAILIEGNSRAAGEGSVLQPIKIADDDDDDENDDGRRRKPAIATCTGRKRNRLFGHPRESYARSGILMWEEERQVEVVNLD